MDDWELRAARNETAFRRVNERLRESRGLADAAETFVFTCECGHLGCNKLLELTLPEYEQVRSHARWFFIVEGHEIEEVERVVERHERYAVVEKLPATAEIAEREDPRKDDDAP